MLYISNIAYDTHPESAFQVQADKFPVLDDGSTLCGPSGFSCIALAAHARTLGNMSDDGELKPMETEPEERPCNRDCKSDYIVLY